jgi:deoxyribonuclease V
MKLKKLHHWNLSCRQAITLQKQLAQKVSFAPLKSQPKLIAGLDCAFSKDGQKIIAAVIVLKLTTTQIQKSQFELVEIASAVQPVNFPYIPGLLSFREAPACIAAVEKLKTTPDLFLIDGQGTAHPRRFGIASHLGLFFNKPTIGCAKSRLTGYFENPAPEKGAYSLLIDKKGYQANTRDERRKTSDKIIGAVVRTKTNTKPVFVSVGNKCSLDNAVKVTLSCATKYRLPEPTRLAHQQVSLLKLKT